MQEKYYFVIRVKDQSFQSGYKNYDFEKQCNSVNYSNPNYLICNHDDIYGKKYEVLAMFPHSSIISIERVELKSCQGKG